MKDYSYSPAVHILDAPGPDDVYSGDCCCDAVTIATTRARDADSGSRGSKAGPRVVYASARSGRGRSLGAKPVPRRAGAARLLLFRRFTGGSGALKKLAHRPASARRRSRRCRVRRRRASNGCGQRGGACFAGGRKEIGGLLRATAATGTAATAAARATRRC